MCVCRLIPSLAYLSKILPVVGTAAHNAQRIRNLDAAMKAAAAPKAGRDKVAEAKADILRAFAADPKLSGEKKKVIFSRVGGSHNVFTDALNELYAEGKWPGRCRRIRRTS